MHTLVLYLWVLVIVSAADDQTQRPAFKVSQNGSPPGYSSGKPFYGTAVLSKSVKVLPNSYKTSQGLAGGDDSPISVPVIVNSNTPFQGNTNQLISVPVPYSNDGSAPTEQSQSTYESNPIQRSRFRNLTPTPVLVKAPASAYRPVTSSPRPFKARDPQYKNDNDSGNPYSNISPSFRLWPKLPEPVPVPVITADSFLKNASSLNTNLIPQYLQKIPVRVKGYQQNQNSVSYPDSSQFQAQQGQPNPIQSSQGPIYIIIPGGNNNAQVGSYQTPTSPQVSYQSQTPQSGNQRTIVLVPTDANSQPNYQNSGSSFNPYSGTQQSQPGQQQLINYGAFSPSNAGSQTQVPSSQQAPLNYAVFAPQNSPGNQLQTQYPDQQSTLNYAMFGQQGTPGGLANSAGQAPQSYAVFAPGSAPGIQPNPANQSPLTYSVLGSSNAGSFPSATPAPQFTSYSSSQSPAPQYVGYPSSTQQPQHAGYSSNPAPSQQPQYVGYSSTPAPSQQPQYVGYSSTPAPSQQPQYAGYPSSPAPSQQPQYVGYSSNPAPSQQLQYAGYPSSPAPSQQPQYVGYSSNPAPSQQPQYVGYSSTPAPSQQPQYVGYSSNPAPSQQPQYVGYSSTPAPSQQPQYVGYPSSPAPSQSSYSQSTPVSHVNFSGAGNSYSYSI